MSTRKELEQARSVATELVQEAARDFESSIQKALKNIETSYPMLVFQEKHTSGWLWRKRTWYTYYKYFEGSMVGIGQYSHQTITLFEKGK